MAGLDYDEAATDRLEAIYLGRDVTAQRGRTLELLGLREGEHVLDIGSGPGFLCTLMGEAVGPRGRVRGVDLSPVMVERSRQRNAADWVSFDQADATALPEPDESLDVLVSTQVAEYVPDVTAFCREAHRVLKPGGRGVFMATDWTTLAWHSEDPARMETVLAAFAPHCADPALPRTFGQKLRAAGFTVERVSTFPILNLDWSDSHYSCQIMALITDYVGAQQTVPDEVLSAWAGEQRALAERGAYYFLSARVYFEVSKPSA